MSSYLNEKISFVVSSLTNYGRKMISKGDFNIKYFQVGDSEYDYNTTKSMLFLRPMENTVEIKNPFVMDNSEEIYYGVPIQNQNTTTIRNVMGNAGFSSNHKPYVYDNCDGSYITSNVETFFTVQLNGQNKLTVEDPSVYKITDHITVIFSTLCGTDVNYPTVNDETQNSLVYKVVSIQGNDLILDRNLPSLNLVGSGQIIKNRYYNNFDVRCSDYDNIKQQDSWNMDIVWSKDIIGSGGLTIDQSYKEYVNSRYLSTKLYFGYGTDENDFVDINGSKILNFPNETISVSYVDSNGDEIFVKPSEQRSVAIINFNKFNDDDFDVNKEFKYYDYLSTSTDESDKLALDNDGELIIDNEYTELYIPFLMYHRSLENTIGLKINVDFVDYFMISNKNLKSKLKFRFLVDEKNNKIGKMFPDQRIFIIDDLDIVAALDYRSNRRFTLPPLTMNTVPSKSANSLFVNNGEEKTLHFTYLIKTGGGQYVLPSNYFTKIDTPTTFTTNTNFNVSLSLNSEEMKFMVNTIDDINKGFVVDEFVILMQETLIGELPKSDSWKVFTPVLTQNVNGFIDVDTLCDESFLIDSLIYEDGSIFDLETYFDSNYLAGNNEIKPNFGETQPFPGSVRVVRSTDIETLDFLVNLPSDQFIKSNNPTYVDGDIFVTEVNLLDKNKKTVVSGKIPIPIKRYGSQVLNIKIDF